MSLLKEKYENHNHRANKIIERKKKKNKNKKQLKKMITLIFCTTKKEEFNDPHKQIIKGQKMAMASFNVPLAQL